MNLNRQDQNQSNEQGPGRMRRGLGCSNWVIWVVLLLLLAPWLLQMFDGGVGQNTQIAYTNFRQQVEDGNVSQVTVTGSEITGTLEESATVTRDGETVEYTNFVTYLPSFGDEDLFTLLQTHDVEVQTQPEQDFNWWILLLNALPFLLLLGVGYFFLRRMSGGGQGQSVFSMGKSRAKLYDKGKQRTTFDDVAGAKGPKRELKEVIEFLKNPERFQRLGGQIPKGVLLVGPPGTGKTLLARAVAGEADVPFFSISGSDFMEMFVGVGASRVRDLFEDAKKAAPSIIFIDELDSIGRQRGAGLGGGHDEREQTLNQLLNEMDGFEPNENVIVMAATNRPDILDQALLRPGRFDRRITVDLPTLKAREQILEIHARNKPLADDVDLGRIARGTPGFSGADLENLLNEGALIAARREKDKIEREDLSEARDKVMMGLEREGMVLTDEECRLLSYHEGGHAIVAAFRPNADPVHKVTIVPRGRAMGVTQQLPERERYLYTRDYMLDRMAVMMGGRASEQLFLETTTSGAENDLKQATDLARRMVINWGMSERLGHVAYGGEKRNVFLGEQIAQQRDYSETTAREIDEEVRRLVDDAFEIAKTTLKDHQGDLEKLVDLLLEKEEVTGEELLELVGLDKEETRETAFAD